MTTPAPPNDSTRFSTAIALFDEANANDPNRDSVEGVPQPRELVYAQRLTDWVLRLNPDASEALRLAARCQHIRRWEIPRDSFPRTREGYLRWKERLKRHHADVAGTMLQSAGYDPETIERVRSLNLKRDLRKDPDCQILEDALCLMFLEHQLGPLAERHPEEKVIVALQKSWAKMSPTGREAALTLNYTPRERELLDKALK